MDKENTFVPNRKIKRIDAKYVSHEIQHLFHIEKGYLYTVIQLLLRPGKVVREYLNENREKYVKPITFIVFNAVLFTVILHFFHIQHNIFNLKGFGPTVILKNNLNLDFVNQWINEHVGYTTLIVALFTALWTKVFFYKKDNNIFEIFVLLAYSFGILFIIIIFFTLFAYLFKSHEMIKRPILQIGIIISQIYIIWSIGQFFGERKIINYVKAIFCFFLGLISFKLILTYLLYLF